MDFLPNDLVLLLVEAVQALFHWFGIGPDLQGVLGDFPRYARHIRGTPRKHIGICVEKVDEHGFLFGVKVGTDCQRLAIRVLGIERDLLGAFLWLEATCMALWLWCLSGKGFESQGELGGFLERFPILDAFDITHVSMLVGGADGDDPLGSGHLQLEVGVVGDSYELGVP